MVLSSRSLPVPGFTRIGAGRQPECQVAELHDDISGLRPLVQLRLSSKCGFHLFLLLLFCSYWEYKEEVEGKASSVPLKRCHVNFIYSTFSHSSWARAYHTYTKGSWKVYLLAE